MVAGSRRRGSPNADDGESAFPGFGSCCCASMTREVLVCTSNSYAQLFSWQTYVVEALSLQRDDVGMFPLAWRAQLTVTAQVI